MNILKENELELKRLNKIISKKMERNKSYKDSNKYNRIRNKINKLHEKITNKRNNIQHNITKTLVDKNVDNFVIEDLSTKNMTKRAKNKNVKAKSGLNKAILDVGFYSLYQKLNYKADSVGKQVFKVDPKYTSQTCSCCGKINKLSRITQSDFKCVHCNYEINADFNASINIKNKFFKNLIIKE